MRTQLKADLSLVLVTFAWGVSYYLMDVALQDVGPFTLNAYRFLLAFAIPCLLTFKRLKKPSKRTLIYSALIGISLYFTYMGATYGVLYTTLSNSGFLCAMAVVIVPIMELVIFKKKPSFKMFIALGMSLIGIILLTLGNDFSLNLSHLKGDLLCLMCAFFYAVDLILTERAVALEDVNAYQIGVFQLGFTGVLMLASAFIFETPTLPQSPLSWFSVLFLSIFCTGISFIVQAIAQQYTTASHVGLIFTLEPVFNGFAAFFLAGEVLTGRGYLGAILMITALFLSEIKFSRGSKEGVRLED